MIPTFLEKRYGLRVMRLLERNTSGQQKKLSRSQRLESIKTAYSLKPFTGLLPQEVTLVDDVCTTGSTLESCAEILKSAGIEKVHAVTLFTVD